MRVGTTVVAVVVGFCVGAAVVLPFNRQLREERDDARNALAAVGPSVVVNSPAALPAPPAVAEPVAAPPADAGTNGAPAKADGEREDGPPAWAGAERFGRGRRGEDAEAQDPAAREARRQEFVQRMRERADAARTDFVERAQLDDAKAAKVDDLVFDLNQRAESIVADWVDYIRESGSFDADYRIRFMHDLTAALVTTYDALDSELPETWRSAAGDFDLLRLIDPDVMRPMMDLQREMGVHGGMMGALFFGGGRGGPPRGPDGERRPPTPTPAP